MFTCISFELKSCMATILFCTKVKSGEGCLIGRGEAVQEDYKEDLMIWRVNI